MGQTLDMLLGADTSKVKNVPTGKVEIKRLTQKLGKPFFINYRAASINELNDIGNNANGNQAEEMKWTIYELTTDPNFKSKELREKFKVSRPVDIVQSILLGGEILTVYNAIMKLSGFDRSAQESIEEVKN